MRLALRFVFWHGKRPTEADREQLCAPKLVPGFCYTNSSAIKG